MYAPLSSLINQALRTDADAQERLRAMGRCTIRLDLAPVPAVGLHIENGSLMVEAPQEHVDLAVRGHPAAFVRYVLCNQASDIHLEGNGEVAQGLRDFLATLDIDWEELLARVIGDTPARVMMRSLAEVAQAAQRFGAATQSNGRDYLHEESGLLPNASEIDQFMREVDRLRDDLARLEQRFDRLVK